MKTAWSETLDPNAILPEYPRPQMVRESYLNLNGVWQYAIAKEGETPEKPAGDILVPFSPESELSGEAHAETEGDALVYARIHTAAGVQHRPCAAALRCGGSNRNGLFEWE